MILSGKLRCLGRFYEKKTTVKSAHFSKAIRAIVLPVNKNEDSANQIFAIVHSRLSTQQMFSQAPAARRS